MKKIVSSLIAGLMAVSLVMMGCSNDSSSDNTALMLLVSGSGSGSGSSGGTVAAGGAVKALADAKTGETVDLSEYKLSDKIALTVDKAITVKNAKLNGGYITVSEKATLDNVDGGTIVLDGNGKNATLKDCDAKNVIVKEAELKEADLSRVVQYFTLKINGGVVEKIINNSLYLIIETTKTTIKKLITEQSLVIKSTDDSKIELIGAREPITLAGKLVIEKAVTESIVKVASNDVSIKKGMVEIEADDSEYAEDNLNIEAIKAAVGELTDSECEALYKTLTALEKEAEEMESKIQAAEEEAKKALEEYKKAVVTFYLVDEGQVLHEENVPLAEVEKALETLTASIPEGGKIELFSDEACTKPVDVKTIKAGDKIYIKVSGDIHDEPVTPGECVTFYVVYEGQVSPEQKVPLTAVEKYLESMTAGKPEGVEIELFSDEACTKLVDVKTIKAGDKIYVKVSGDIHDEPVTPGEYVTFYEVYEGQVSPERKVPLAELEKVLEGMTADDVEIELFSDEACTKPVDVKDIKDGDTIYIKVSGLPDLPDEQYVIVNGENVPLYTMIADLEDGQSFYINGEVNMEDANAWLPMTGNVFIFEYNEKMNAWGSKTGSVKVNMTRNAAENPYEDGVKVSVWDKSENISWEGGAIGLNGLVQGKMYALVMTNSTQANNTDGKGKHVELYEVVMNGSMGE
ncbi:MAG: hypothetical protein UHJ46_06140 [Treponema sp.]|nr:hypothetical protein [Treponema sp.]